MSGKQTGSTFCWSSTIYLLPTASVPLLWEPNVQTLKGDLTNLWTSGAQYCWAHCGFLSYVQSAPSIPIAPSALTSGGHYWTDRDGFGGHGIYGFHQTFIPAFNSTTARVERPDSKGRRIESQRSGNSQPISGNKNRINILLIVHHLTWPTYCARVNPLSASDL